MEGKKIIRMIISIGLFVALITIIFVSQGHDPNNPHASIPKEEWISGEKGHGFAVINNQNPQKQCYQCHENKVWAERAIAYPVMTHPGWTIICRINPTPSTELSRRSSDRRLFDEGALGLGQMGLFNQLINLDTVRNTVTALFAME